MGLFKFLSPVFKRDKANEVHKATLNSLDSSLESLNEDVDLIKLELLITEASSDWLKIYAEWFGVKLLSGETEDELRQRILMTLQREQVTIPAIISAVKDILGQDTIVEVYEPFNDVWIWNVSAYSGSDRYEDGDYYRIGVIDIIVNKEITSRLREYINVIVAAGVSVKFTYDPTLT